MQHKPDDFIVNQIGMQISGAFKRLIKLAFLEYSKAYIQFAPLILRMPIGPHRSFNDSGEDVPKWPFLEIVWKLAWLVFVCVFF